MRARVFWHTGIPVITGMLVACGGGGGGSGYNAPPPTPPPASPTVNIAAPSATSINFGQAVTLNWTTTNATSCTGSSSSDIGKAFNIAQPTGGPVSIAPTAQGNVSFTLTCTGAGGSATATSVVIAVQPSILSTLKLTNIVELGSTTDPNNNDTNPYGLAIAPATAGRITAGDVIVCNFSNNVAGDEGDGTTIVGLHPTPGANPQLQPYEIAQSPLLQGCNALAVLPDDSISAAAWKSSQNPLVTADGAVNNPFEADKLVAPWGEAYVPAKGSNPAALYVSTFDGTIQRITLNGDAQTAITRIANGFCTSGVAGSIFAPSGLTYDASIDTLYIVDTSSYSVVAFAKVSSIGADGVAVNGQCPPAATAKPPTAALTFGGPSASSARVIATGGGFIAPLSAALLADGDLIVTNADVGIDTANQTPNQVFEISPVLPGGFVGKSVQLDTSGTPGALFGIVATVDAQGHQIVYFNDDNAGAVGILTQ